MERYIGLDVHSTNCSCVVLSPSGRKTKEAVIATTGPALREFVRSIRRPRVVVMEEGNQSDWLYEVLAPHGDEVLVVQPEASKGRKSDRSDAERLARLVRLNEPGRVIYKAPGRLPELRQAARSYLSTRKNLTRSRSQLKLLFQSRGLLASANELLDADDRLAWCERLPAHIDKRARLLGTELDAMAELHEQARTWLLEQSRQVRGVRWVKTVPGIGDIRAALIVSAIVSPHRFRTKRQLWNYSGLGIVTRSSNDWELKGDRFVRRRGHEQVLGLNTNRHPVLKEAFVGAAQQIIGKMPGHPLHRRYRERIERGIKPSNARLTLARQLAAITLAVWKKEQSYDPTLS